MGLKRCETCLASIRDPCWIARGTCRPRVSASEVIRIGHQACRSRPVDYFNVGWPASGSGRWHRSTVNDITADWYQPKIFAVRMEKNTKAPLAVRNPQEESRADLPTPQGSPKNHRTTNLPEWVPTTHNTSIVTPAHPKGRKPLLDQPSLGGVVTRNCITTNTPRKKGNTP